MKKHLFLTLCSLFLSGNIAYSAFERLPHSARVTGLGMASSAMQNVSHSIFTNPAGTTGLSQIKITFDFSRPFGINELDMVSASGVFPLKYFDLALGVSSLGNEIYAERSIVAGFSKTIFKKISLGISICIYETEVKNYGGDHSFAVNAGFLMPLTDKLNWGVYTTNLTRSEMKHSADLIPQNFSAGISFLALKNLIFNLDVFKEVTFPAELRSGIEYCLGDKLAFRSGIISEPGNYCFGVGFKSKFVTCDYAATFHTQLGMTHQISINFQIGNKF